MFACIFDISNGPCSSIIEERDGQTDRQTEKERDSNRLWKVEGRKKLADEFTLVVQIFIPRRFEFLKAIVKANRKRE